MPVEHAQSLESLRHHGHLEVCLGVTRYVVFVAFVLHFQMSGRECLAKFPFDARLHRTSAHRSCTRHCSQPGGVLCTRDEECSTREERKHPMMIMMMMMMMMVSQMWTRRKSTTWRQPTEHGAHRAWPCRCDRSPAPSAGRCPDWAMRERHEHSDACLCPCVARVQEAEVEDRERSQRTQSNLQNHRASVGQQLPLMNVYSCRLSKRCHWGKPEQ
mmetsp:Transcript_13512/g.40756  ORF Transcript_13512/g.40756 Transcript_13512/m.40756 type:complete len:215 (-) Transcript_13512:37-681(-)